MKAGGIIFFLIVGSVLASESEPFKLDSGWQYRWGDSPVDSSGVAVWTQGVDNDGVWREAETLFNPAGRDKEEFVWLRRKVPSCAVERPALYLPHVLVAFELYVDSSRIYASGELAPVPENKFAHYGWHLVALPAACEGKMLFLRIYSNSQATIGVTDDDDILIGSQLAILTRLMRRNFDTVIIGFLLIFTGLFSILIFFRRFKERVVFPLSFGAFAVGVGLFYVVNDDLSQLLIKNSVIRYYLGLTPFIFFPVALYAFFEEILAGTVKKKAIRIIWIVHLTYAVIALVLDLTNVSPLLITNYYFLWLFLASIVTTLVVSARAAMEGNPEARIFIVGFIVFGLFGVHDILMGLRVIPIWRWLSHYGALAFVLSLGYILERRNAQDEQKLQAYSRDLETISTRLKTSKDQLEEYSQTLENKVADRTQDLNVKNEELQTTLKQLQDAQNQLVLQEKMASLGNLVAGVAHEVNTPIGAVTSATDVSKRCLDIIRERLAAVDSGEDLNEDMQFQKALRLLEENNRISGIATERVVRIVRSLKSFARLDEAEFQKADIHDGLDNTLTLLHHEIKNRIEVEKDYGDIPQIKVFPGQLNQVFMNILKNASQAIEDRGKIKIRTWMADSYVNIEISDDGKGIPPDKIDKIFDPGFTTKGVGVGTGLGLSISYNIIQKHKGRITVKSEVGKGTTFTISLPAE